MSSTNNVDQAGSSSSSPNLGAITGENVKSCLNTLKQLQRLEKVLPELLTLSEFWQLENEYIYELCEPYKTREFMENAFLDWILADPPNRREFHDKLCDFKKLEQTQNQIDLKAELGKSKERIQELEEQVKQSNETVTSQKLQFGDLIKEIREKTSTIAKRNERIQELEERMKQLNETVISQKLQFDDKLKQTVILDTKIGSLTEEIHEKTSTIAKKNERIQELEERMKELDQIITSQKLDMDLKINGDLEKISTLDRKIENLTQELETAKTQLTNLSKNLEETTKRLAESQILSTHQAKLEKQEKQIHDLNEQSMRKEVGETSSSNILAQGKSPESTSESTAAKRSNPNAEKPGPADTAVPVKRVKITTTQNTTDSSNSEVTQELIKLFGHKFDTSLPNLDKLQKAIRIGPLMYWNSSWNLINLLDKDGKHYKEIADKDWKPEYASYFRQLEVGDILRLNIYEVYAALSPHITSLKLSNLTSYWIYNLVQGEKLCQFVDKFTNLQDLEVECRIFLLETNAIGLETFLESFIDKKSTVKILFKVDLGLSPDNIDGLDNILDTLVSFGKKIHNLKFKFSGINSFGKLYAIWYNCGPSPKSKYTLDVSDEDPLHIYKCGELESLTSISRQYPYLEVFLVLHVENFQPTQQKTIKNCLANLSPIITKLRIENENTEVDVVDVTNFDCGWPKLLQLEVEKYDHPLEILKRCPKLEFLKFSNVNLNKCVFHDPEKSAQASATYYFSNLPELKWLRVDPSRGKGSLKLRTHLKSILSPRVEIW